MSVFRVNKDKDNPYVIINKQFLEDSKLSWKAKGLLSYLLSLPDDWQIYESELVKHSKDGRDSTKSAIKELIDNGYIERERKRDEKGMLKHYEYSVYERSIHIGKSNVGKSNVGESVTTNIITKLNNNNTNIYIDKNDKINIADEIKEIRSKYLGTKTKSVADKKLPKLIKEYGKEQLIRTIERYNKYVEEERTKGFKTLKYKNESTWWNGGYMDYLDSEYDKKQDTILNTKENAVGSSTFNFGDINIKY